MIADTTVHISQGLQTWQVIVYPAATLLLTGVLTAVGLWPFLSRRHKAQELERLRQAAAQNVVLGLPADPEVGRYQPIEGLVVTVPRLAKAIGTFDDGQTLAGTLAEVRAEQAHVADELKEHRASVEAALDADHRDVKTALEQHQASDTATFSRIQDTLDGLASTLDRRVIKDASGKVMGTIEIEEKPVRKALAKAPAKKAAKKAPRRR